LGKHPQELFSLFFVIAVAPVLPKNFVSSCLEKITQNGRKRSRKTRKTLSLPETCLEEEFLPLVSPKSLSSRARWSRARGCGAAAKCWRGREGGGW
jgi:hypothetical protein